MATRAVTAGGSTLSRYSGVCCSNRSHDGIDTTRDADAGREQLLVGVERQAELAAGGDEDHLGRAAGRIGQHVGAPRHAAAGARRLRSSVGSGWRDSTSTAGWCRNCRTVR